MAQLGRLISSAIWSAFFAAFTTLNAIAQIVLAIFLYEYRTMLIICVVITAISMTINLITLWVQTNEIKKITGNK